MSEITFRDFYDYLMQQHAGRRWSYLSLDILLGRGQRHAPLMQRLARYAPATARHVRGDALIADSWQLYALSRVSDHLALPFQTEHPNAQSTPAMPQLSALR